jgi:hypothetical protein
MRRKAEQAMTLGRHKAGGVHNALLDQHEEATSGAALQPATMPVSLRGSR